LKFATSPPATAAACAARQHSSGSTRQPHGKAAATRRSYAAAGGPPRAAAAPAGSSGNKSNVFPQASPVFSFFGEGCGDPLPPLPGSRPYRAPVCWRSRRNRHHAREAESARPVARQPTTRAPAATPTASTAAFPASLRRRGSSPCICLFASGALRLRAPSPSASGRSAADAPGPPKHLGSLRGVRRYRRIASRLRFGAPTGCGHLPRDPGGGREADQRYRASGRFRPRRSPGRRAPWCSRYFSSSPAASGPRNTWECIQAQGNASEIPRLGIFLHGDALRGGWGFLGLLSGRGWGLSLPGSRRGYESTAAHDFGSTTTGTRWSRSSLNRALATNVILSIAGHVSRAMLSRYSHVRDGSEAARP
jgi:hypothetical protein